MEPPETLMCDLRPYQKQALYWMSELEKGVDVEKAGKTLHPCWAAYKICDGYAVFFPFTEYPNERKEKCSEDEIFIPSVYGGSHPLHVLCNLRRIPMKYRKQHKNN